MEGIYFIVCRLESEKSMEYLNLLQLYGLEISLAGTCALSYRQMIHIAHLFPLSHFLRLSNISILASKLRGWKNSNQRSNNLENAQLSPGHSGSYLNAYIGVYLPNGSDRRTNRYIYFNANRNHFSSSYARLKNHTFLLEVKSNRALK